MQESILYYFQKISNPFLDLLFQGATVLGEELIFIVLITYIFWNVSKKEGFTIAGILLSSQLINGIIKVLVQAPRPFQVLPGIEGKRLATATGYSFPSGHTQGAAAFYTTLALEIKKSWFRLTMIILIVLVAVSRMYLGVHWPIDTIAGGFFGVLISLLLFNFLRKIWENKQFLAKFLLINGGGLLGYGIILSILSSMQPELRETYSDLIKIAALVAGFFLGMHGEEQFVNFSIESSTRIKVLRFIVGLATSLVILKGSKFILPDQVFTDFFRYFTTGLWICFLFPLVGSKIHLKDQVLFQLEIK